MSANPIRSALLILTASIGLSGCAGYYGGLGSGVSVSMGNGYYGDRYGYPGYGYGSPYGYGGYGYGANYGYGYPGYGYGSPYFGWYDGFYYPGVGYYVYNSAGSRYRWSDAQRRYWESRRPTTTKQVVTENWTGFRTNGIAERQRIRTERRNDRVASRPLSVRQTTTVQPTTVRQERAARTQRAETRQQVRQSTRTERRQTRQERRDERRD